MTDIYAMRRANGDWFSFAEHGRLGVPIFHSSHDALMARLRNFEMLLFAPVALDARRLNEIATVDGGTEVHFYLIEDPFASLKRGIALQPAELTGLTSNSEERQTVVPDTKPQTPRNRQTAIAMN